MFNKVKNLLNKEDKKYFAIVSTRVGDARRDEEIAQAEWLGVAHCSFEELEEVSSSFKFFRVISITREEYRNFRAEHRAKSVKSFVKTLHEKTGLTGRGLTRFAIVLGITAINPTVGAVIVWADFIYRLGKDSNK
jgi:hypothetical protein